MTAEPHASTRQRIVTAAVDLTSESGWSAVTMSRLAERVGVSRQTVYNEVGSKPLLAEAVIADELSRFTEAIHVAFDQNEGNPVSALREASYSVLMRAEKSDFLRSIVNATQGVDTELLPALTTRSSLVVEGASAAVLARLTPMLPEMGSDRIVALTDVIVRTVLSHVMQPSGTAEQTADTVAWLATACLAAATPQ